MPATLTIRLANGETRELSPAQARAAIDRLWASTEIPGAALAAISIAAALDERRTNLQLDDWQSMAMRATDPLDAGAD